MLCRFRDADAGTVHVDGTDVTSVPPEEIRRTLSGMPQDPYQFDDVVRIGGDHSGSSAAADDVAAGVSVIGSRGNTFST